MPRCMNCDNRTPSRLLVMDDSGRVTCPDCRTPIKLVEGTMAKRDTNVSKDKKIFSMEVLEFPTGDGGVDHRIEVEGSYAGLDIRFASTVDQIRKFFTEERAPGEKRKLKSV